MGTLWASHSRLQSQWHTSGRKISTCRSLKKCSSSIWFLERDRHKHVQLLAPYEFAHQQVPCDSWVLMLCVFTRAQIPRTHACLLVLCRHGKRFPLTAMA